MDEENKMPKKIEIISGDGDDLEISEVYNHINLEDSPSDNPIKENIVIPPEKK